jgi:hypothetical protein
MGWVSYIALELQLFLVLPLFYVLYRCHKKTAVFILMLMIVLGLGMNGFLIWHSDILPGYLFAFDFRKTPYLALSPLTKLDSYCLGILMALVYHRIFWFNIEATEKEKSRDRLLEVIHYSAVPPVFLWMASILCFGLCLLSPMYIDLYD